jgi:hypothetical protein
LLAMPLKIPASAPKFAALRVAIASILCRQALTAGARSAR